MKRIIIFLISFLTLNASLIALDPTKITMSYSDGSSAEIDIDVFDYGNNSLKYSESKGTINTNASGVFSFYIGIGDATWESINVSDITENWIINVKVDNALYAQYRLDEVLLETTSTGSISETSQTLANNIYATSIIFDVSTITTAPFDIDHSILNDDHPNGTILYMFETSGAGSFTDFDNNIVYFENTPGFSVMKVNGEWYIVGAGEGTGDNNLNENDLLGVGDIDGGPNGMGLNTINNGNISTGDGNFNINGDVNLGNGSGDDINMNGTVQTNIIPTTSGGGVDLGSDNNRWADVYVLGGSMHIGDAGGEASNDEISIGYNAGTATVSVDGASSLTLTDAGITVPGTTTSTGAFEVSGGGATITGNSSVDGTFTSTGAISVDAGGADITGNTVVTGNLNVTGILTENGSAVVASGDAAGGDLAGTYPDPTIAANAVGSTEIAEDAVTNTEIDNSGNFTFAGVTASTNGFTATIGGLTVLAGTSDLDDAVEIEGNITLDNAGAQTITHAPGGGNLSIVSTNDDILIEGSTFSGNNLTIPGNVTLSALAGGGTQSIGVDNNGLITTVAGGGGISTYGYTYDLDGSGQTVAGGADVVFSNNGSLSGVTHTAGTSTHTVPNTGTYAISYNVNITAGVGAAIAIAINGTVDASTNKTILTAVGPHSGSVIITLTAGDVLTLRNNSATPFTTDSSPGVGAQMNIKLLN